MLKVETRGSMLSLSSRQDDYAPAIYEAQVTIQMCVNKRDLLILNNMLQGGARLDVILSGLMLNTTHSVVNADGELEDGGRGKVKA